MTSPIVAPFKFLLAKALHSPLSVPPLVVLLALAVGFLTSSTETPTLHAAALQGAKRIDAPDLVGGTDWLNTDKPISLADLKGRIVLLDFWTFCCINCIHTLPDLAEIEATYPGIVVVIGVHSPKFDNEKKTANILKAILRYEIKHPVVNDADKKIWNAYNINHWPTLILIDPDGKFRGAAKGEGHLALVHKNIKELIKEFDGKGLLKTPLKFKLETEKVASPLNFPGKILADAKSKRLFIADSTNHRIVITDLEGKKIAVAGTGKEGLKDGAFADAQFSDPQGMVLSGDTLYVADRKNHAIRALNLKTETVKRVAGTGEKMAVFAKPGKSGPALKFDLSSPWDLLLHDKRMYIAMAGQNQLWTWDMVKDTVSIWAGTGWEAIIDGPLATSAFAQPSGLATDGKRLFVADSESSSIRSVPLPDIKGVIKGTVGTIVGVSGPKEHLFNYGDKNGIGRDVRLQHALGVVYLDGMLYIADTYNNKIKLIDPIKRSCTTFLAGENLFHEPGGLSIAVGKMYVADTNNHRIQVVDMKTKETTTLQLQGVNPVPRAEAASAGQK
ncbi:MAG: redoxin domain-containing protein [Gemmataceae bacterium]|nr:redoxin domain-containing protein [Gemmataceae bacterium]